MADKPAIAERQPGADEIILTSPASGTLCNSLTCKRQRRPAEVVVTYGQLSGAGWDKTALWPDCWGRSYPHCAECWDRARQVVEKHRPGLVVRDCRPGPHGRPAAGAGGM
jgi:hypothetical protein